MIFRPMYKLRVVVISNLERDVCTTTMCVAYSWYYDELLLQPILLAAVFCVACMQFLSNLDSVCL